MVIGEMFLQKISIGFLFFIHSVYSFIRQKHVYSQWNEI